MFAAYLLYLKDEAYDHIMPAVGIQYSDENRYDPEDVLIYYNLYHEKQIQRKMAANELASTRKTCTKHCGQGGCIPLEVMKSIQREINHFIDCF